MRMSATRRDMSVSALVPGSKRLKGGELGGIGDGLIWGGIGDGLICAIFLRNVKQSLRSGFPSFTRSHRFLYAYKGICSTTTGRWPRPSTIKSRASDPFARPRVRDGSR